MKLRQLLMAGYVFALALFPCMDQELSIGSEDGFAWTSLLTMPQDAQQEDICSPFCICSCCSAHIRLAAFTSVTTFGHSVSSKLNSFYFERPETSDGRSIWQPPRA